MLYASRLSTTPTRIICLPNTKFGTSCIFSQIGRPQRVYAGPRYGSISVKCPSEGHKKDPLFSSGIEPSGCQLALLSTELHRRYSWDINVKCLSQRTTTRYV